MKKYVMLALATVFMLSTTLNAQKPQRANQKKGDKKEIKQEEQRMMSPEKKVEFMAKQLNLTDAEKVKVQALFEKQATTQKAQMEEMKKVREEQKAKFEANRKAQEADLIKIIGNDKFQQLQAIQIDHLKKMNRSDKMKNMRKHRMNKNQECPSKQNCPQDKK